MKDRNWFMQAVVLSFISLFRNYRTLPVPAQSYLNYCLCLIPTLDYHFQKQEHLKNFAWVKLFQLPYLIRGIAGSYSLTKNLKVIKLKTEISSLRRSFCHSVLYSQITGPYQFLLQIIENTAFVKELHYIISSKNRNIWKIWWEVSSFNYRI